MKIATLFSGIGAPEQAARRVHNEVKIVFACELDKFARQSYEANYDIDPKHFHADVNDLDATQYKGKVDMLIGGSPCQTFSIAGLRKGTEDEKGRLIYQYIRVVSECRPEVIVYENVKGILSIDNGNTIKDFVQALRDIGYYCHYDIVNTKDYGVPQNRERLYLVGFLNGDDYLRFKFAQKQQLKKKLSDILEDETSIDEKYYLSDEQVSSLINNIYAQARSRMQPGDVSDTLLARDYKDPKCINVIGMLDIKGTDQIRRVYDTSGIAATLTTMQGGNQEPKIVVHSRIRKLTPRECFRLQDFPDSFRFVVSNSQLYKQIGNSMSVNVLEMIFNQIEKAKIGSCKNSLLDFIS